MASSWPDSLRGKQVPLLLAYLVLARQRPVGREELIGALWPDNAPRSQDAALRTLLSRLRSSLGADVLVGRDELLLELPEPVWVDVEAAVTHVERALAALEADDARRAWALAQVPLNIAAPRSAPRRPGQLAREFSAASCTMSACRPWRSSGAPGWPWAAPSWARWSAPLGP